MSRKVWTLEDARMHHAKKMRNWIILWAIILFPFVLICQILKDILKIFKNIIKFPYFYYKSHNKISNTKSIYNKLEEKRNNQEK